ncbi:MAG: formyltransferase family protein [Candidatus Nitrosotenuis sp.]
MKKSQYSCILLVARNHGLESLKNLIRLDRYKIIAIFTHMLNPKTYDPERKIRSDYKDFVKIAELNKIPLFTIDNKSELSILKDFSEQNEYDFLISISWRYLIPPYIFNKAKIGSINLHRGDLPKYAGVEPIKRALQNNEKEIVVCAHHITENYDAGEVICKAKHPVNYDYNKTLDENVDRLKEEITPYFPQLTIKSLEILLREYAK